MFLLNQIVLILLNQIVLILFGQSFNLCVSLWYSLGKALLMGSFSAPVGVILQLHSFVAT